MKRIALVCLLGITIGCTPCDDPPMEGFLIISYHILEGTNEVFSTDDARNSLQVISLERNKPVDFAFSSASFSINDKTYDEMAKDALICPSYILRYRTSDVDTLKVCYQIKSSECDGDELESVRVFWNQELMAYSGRDATATIVK